MKVPDNIGIFFILLLVNILIPLGIKKEIKSAEKILNRILTNLEGAATRKQEQRNEYHTET